MAEPAAPPQERSASGWVTAPFASSSWPVWRLGLVIALGYVVLHWAFDALFWVSVGFPEDHRPAWRTEVWWPDVINAALTGYLPAALAFARRGVLRDLDELRPWLRGSADELAALHEMAAGPGGPEARALCLAGLLVGVLLVWIDPSMAGGAAPSPSHPVFVWSLLRNAVFVWLTSCLIVSDFNTTRAYTRMGRERVVVDLLDVDALAVFARRGQRSALTWVLFSTIFSLFWIGDTAARGNAYLLVLALSMATAAFALPLIGVHRNIRSVKRAELARLREEIRAERGVTFATHEPGPESSPRLANLIAWYQLTEGTREWPVDAANLLRVLAYLLLGVGSWLGGALVERVLNVALPG